MSDWRSNSSPNCRANMIEVEISGPCGEGKTCIAFLLRSVLEDIGIEVEYTNPDAPSLSRSQLTEEQLKEKYRHYLKGRKVKLIEVARG